MREGGGAGGGRPLMNFPSEPLGLSGGAGAEGSGDKGRGSPRAQAAARRVLNIELVMKTNRLRGGAGMYTGQGCRLPPT